CRHCKKLVPEYEKLVTSFKKAKSVLIGKILGFQKAGIVATCQSRYFSEGVYILDTEIWLSGNEHNQENILFMHNWKNGDQLEGDEDIKAIFARSLKCIPGQQRKNDKVTPIGMQLTTYSLSSMDSMAIFL
ncbi:hypothetical protein FRX31_028360, partial [Thalictrum thalictroides]